MVGVSRKAVVVTAVRIFGIMVVCVGSSLVRRPRSQGYGMRSPNQWLLGQISGGIRFVTA